MHVSLTDRLDKYVRDKVATGLYNNASEVIREALRRQIEAEESLVEKRARLLAEIDVGWAQIERGETVPLDIDEINREIDLEFGVAEPRPLADAKG